MYPMQMYPKVYKHMDTIYRSMEGQKPSKVFRYRIKVSVLDGDREVVSKVVEPTTRMAVSTEVLKATWELIKSLEK